MAERRYFDLAYEERTRLRDGTPVVLRLLRPSDAELLRQGFEKLSPDSRYRRFFAPKPRLSEEELRYLTVIDHENHLAIGAVRDGDDTPGAGLGIARFIRVADDPDTADAAVAVLDEIQGRGLGRLLLLRLCAAAHERGIRTFRCDVLASNVAMKNLLASLAPSRHVEGAGPVQSLELDVPAVAPDTPNVMAPEHPMYRLLRAAAEHAVDVPPLPPLRK